MIAMQLGIKTESIIFKVYVLDKTIENIANI